MTKFDRFQQTVAAALAALLLTGVSVGAAVGPARAIETAPVYAVTASAPGHANV